MRFALLALLSACTSGAPPGFSGGTNDRWTMPLVGPLENGALITTVTINTYGPYLFAIDPDAPMSVIDTSVVKSADLRTFAGPKRLDETDTQQTRIYAELSNLEIGTLIVERRDAFIVRNMAFDTAGRRVNGILGRDVFADSTAWGFDRDHGIVYMTTQKFFEPPPGATAISYAEYPSRVTNAQVVPPPRRLVDATVNGEKLTLHVDLGAPASQLRERVWDTAKLGTRDVKTVAVDEVGEGRLVTKASEPAQVTLAGITNDRVAFIPYTDKRWPSEDLAGTLGLGFFANHDVWQSWHTKQYFATPRQEVSAAIRINRWDSAVLSRCKNVGCVTIRITDPLTGKTIEEGKPLPGLVLSVTREAVAGGMGLEVILDATREPVPPEAAPGAAGATLPRLAINMPGHVDKLLYPLPATFRGTTLTVLDASPFPRECPSPNGCIDQLAR
jgi:Aspartyl protease